MNFTVFGARGFVGRHLSDYLRRQGHSVFEPARDGEEWATRPLGHAIYCIGLTADFRTRPFATVDAHVSLLNNVLERAQFDSLLYLSSTRVYSESSAGKEDEPVSVLSLNSSDLYNLTKLTGESICFSCGRDNVRAARLSNVVGEDTGSSNFLYDIAREALAGEIKLQTALASSKDYIGIDDVVEMLPLITQNGKEKLYNLASGIKVSHGELANRLQQITGCEITVMDGAKTITFADVNIHRLASEFGFTPRPILGYLPDIIEQLK
jgi:nucleoside-diphosphate-sugar epimerase